MRRPRSFTIFNVIFPKTYEDKYEVEYSTESFDMKITIYKGYFYIQILNIINVEKDFKNKSKKQIESEIEELILQNLDLPINFLNAAIKKQHIKILK